MNDTNPHPQAEDVPHQSPRIGALFAGYGGLEMGVQAALGGTVAWHSEYDPPTKKNPRPDQAAARILAHHWPSVPNLGDITKVDWSRVEPVDIITGGSPCQDVSSAGKRQGMRAGTRSGLWASMVDAIDVLRPRLVVWENVRGVTSACAHSELEPCPGCVGGTGPHRPVLRALGRVLGDLADLGYDAQWHGLRAADVGAPHGRFRVFVVAQPAGSGWAGFDDRASGTATRAGWQRFTGRGAGHATATDTSHVGHERSRPARDGWAGSEDGGCGAATHPDRDAVRQQPVTEPWRSSPAFAGLTGSDTATDADIARSQGREPARRRQLPDGRAAADTSGDRWDEGRPESARLIGGSDAALSGDAATNAERGRRNGGPLVEVGQPLERVAAAGSGEVNWGQYAPAIARWERALGRVAPAPTEAGAKGGQRLSPRFVEWMMGLPEGHVTDPAIGISRNAQLKALGNGVVPQQAAAAIQRLMMVEQAAA